MADFTMVLRDLVNNPHYENIGLDDYPIFDEKYRGVLNQRIIDHYYYDEIGHETPDIFIRQMRTKMREIMPYYNKMYLSTLKDFDPLTTHDLTTLVDSTLTGNVSAKNNSAMTGEDTATVTQSSTTDNRSRVVNSDTPQVRLSGSEDYASSAVDTTGKAMTGGDSETVSRKNDSVKTNSVTSSDTKNVGTTKTIGRSASAASLLNEYRASLINVDLMVIDELKTLFMQVWSSQDAITEGYYYYG